MRLGVLLLALGLASCTYPNRIESSVAGDGQPVRLAFGITSSERYDLYLQSPRYESRTALDSLISSLEGFELVISSESVDSSYTYDAVRAVENSPHGLGGALVRLLSSRAFEAGEWVTVEASFPRVSASDSVSIGFIRAPK